jgi:hypothetical protein
MKKILLLSVICMHVIYAYPAYILSKDGNGNNLWFETTSATTVEVFALESAGPGGNIVIPSSINDNGNTYTVTSIANGAFSFKGSITSVSIPNTVTVIGENAFSQCSQLSSVSIGDGVTEIMSSAFNGCTSLTSVDLGNSVAYIRRGAFHLCPIRFLTIPASVTFIGSNNFDTGGAITCYATTPPECETNAFGSFENILAVPEASLPDYSAAPVWKDLKEVRPAFEKQEATIPLDEVSVGDILLSDGTLVKRDNFSKDESNLPVGVVFYVCESLKEAWVCSLTDQARNVEWIIGDRYPLYDEYGKYIEGSFDRFRGSHNEFFLKDYCISYPGSDTYSFRQVLSDLDGKQNTAFISRAAAPAFVAARSYGRNWYLPAAGQLRLLYANYDEVAKSFGILNANGVIAEKMDKDYFTSTENHFNTAFIINSFGDVAWRWKSNFYDDGHGLNNVRAVYTIPLLEAGKTPKYKIGDLITNNDGTKGVVFYINPERTEGWMVSLHYMNYQNEVLHPFSPGSDGYLLVLLPTTGIWDDLLPYVTDYDGEGNTQALKQKAGASFFTQYPAAYVAALPGEGWYLPALGQLNHYLANTPFIADAIFQNGGDDILFPRIEGYWSSSTVSATGVQIALTINYSGAIFTTSNGGEKKVRPVKSFTIPQGGTTTDAPKIVSEKIRITSGKGCISINEIEDKTVSIYNMSGILCAGKAKASFSERFELQAGMYVVRVGNDVQKVMVK